MRRTQTEGFTLVELLIATGILAVVLTGLIMLFIRCSVLANLTHNKTVAMSEVQSLMEVIREHSFDDIVTDYAYGGSLNPFDLEQLNGKGVIYIDSSNAELLRIEIVVSWENKFGRIIGEDLDLDGVLDSGSPGEDINGDSKISSIATVVSLLAKR